MKKTILSLATALVFIGCGGGGGSGNSEDSGSYDTSSSQDTSSISSKSINMVGTWNLSITNDYNLCIGQTATAIVTITKENNGYHFYSRWQDKGFNIGYNSMNSTTPISCFTVDVRNYDLNTRKDWIVNEIDYNNTDNSIGINEMRSQNFKYILSFIEACDTSDMSNITDLGINIQSETQFIHITQLPLKNSEIGNNTAIWTKQQ